MSYDDCDYEPMHFYDESWHVARKGHMCSECHTVIRPGEKYLYCRGKWGSDFSVFKQHEECLAACVSVRKIEGSCVPFGGLMEWYEDDYDPSYKREWPKSVRSAIAKVLMRRRRNVICGLYVSWRHGA